MYPAGAVAAAAAAARPALQAASRVEKATSHLLMGPDWTVNLEICDIINADVWHTKDVVKAVKKRLQNKDPKVQYYALTLLETMMKNCGEYVQFEVSEQHVLQEMVKIIQKKYKVTGFSLLEFLLPLPGIETMPSFPAPNIPEGHSPLRDSCFWTPGKKHLLDLEVNTRNITGHILK